MTTDELEMLAGGIKPDFEREDVDADGECANCSEDEPVVYVNRLDVHEMLCQACGEQIPEKRRIREYIKISELPGEDTSEDAELSAADMAKEFAHPELKRVFVVIDDDREIKAILKHSQVKPVSMSTFSDSLSDAVAESEAVEFTSSAVYAVIGVGEELVLATVTLERISTVAIETAENYIEENVL